MISISIPSGLSERSVLAPVLLEPESRYHKIKQKKISTYLFTALGCHLGAALPMAGVATHCRQQNTIKLLVFLQPHITTVATTAAVSHHLTDSGR